MHQNGYIEVHGGPIYYEVAGDGTPFVMIHAGVADSRQWNHEFTAFADSYRVVRYDQRGFGKSVPHDSEYSLYGDFVALVETLQVARPFVLMGGSMGGGTALDYALDHPQDVKALILVGSGPSGLALDVPSSEKFVEVEAAFNEGDLDRVCELEMQIWFDGPGRTAADVDQQMRALAYEMNRLALELEVRGIGRRLPSPTAPAAGRLASLQAPLLVIVGEHDQPYMHGAANVMAAEVPKVRVAPIADAGHLPNMDQPAEFQRIVRAFLNDVA
ncbi:MAG: alpha/beta hydrolase [Anaerolineales bacterium]|nr:alpha/beta hydrolase [Anaerolineales bacterium]MCB9127286.1 alpha/beta hydrolase [Ardenticatenales bacterium]MCB9172575.1 alpha/beta hydrolase [Ardenticatenales bacterium]